MISLKKADNTDFFLNPWLIEQIQSMPDVVITLNGGKKILVKDTINEVLDKILGFWRTIMNLENKAEYLRGGGV